MQGGKNWLLPKEMNANRFFWDSHWLEIWSNHFYPSMGPNGGSVAMDSGVEVSLVLIQLRERTKEATSGVFNVRDRRSTLSLSSVKARIFNDGRKVCISFTL
jgi:hypothetical protein